MTSRKRSPWRPRGVIHCPLLQRRRQSAGKVIPELDGRLTGYSLRVPVPVVSIVDLTVTLEREVTAEQVNEGIPPAAASGRRRAFSATATSRWSPATIRATRVLPLSMACRRW